jgi:hypothetical protein
LRQCALPAYENYNTGKTCYCLAKQDPSFAFCTKIKHKAPYFRIQLTLNQIAMKNLRILCFTILSMFLLGSCAGTDNWSSKKKGAVVGGTAGAATGAAVGGTTGAVVGGAAGAATGGAIGRKKDKKKARQRNQDYQQNQDRDER